MNRRSLPFLGLLIFACAEQPTQPTTTEFPSLEDATARVNVVAAPGADGITLTTLTIDARSLALGAYQGRFRFDPDALELIDYSLPEGDYRFVNTNNAEQGEIRYAGFTVGEFKSLVALVLRFRTRRALQLDDLSAELEVVGDVLGREVKRDRILEPRLQIER